MNGVFHVNEAPGAAMPHLDGRLLGDKDALLTALGAALHFPDYYGANWDALEECLGDLSWQVGPLSLLITHADSLPADLRETLEEIFTEAAQQWAEEGRPFALYLVG